MLTCHYQPLHLPGMGDSRLPCIGRQAFQGCRCYVVQPTSLSRSAVCKSLPTILQHSDHLKSANWQYKMSESQTMLRYAALSSGRMWRKSLKPRSCQHETQTSYTEKGPCSSTCRNDRNDIEWGAKASWSDILNRFEQNMSDTSLDMVAYHLCNWTILEPQLRHMRKNLVKASGRKRLCRCALEIFKVLHMHPAFLACNVNGAQRCIWPKNWNIQKLQSYLRRQVKPAAAERCHSIRLFIPCKGRLCFYVFRSSILDLVAPLQSR